MKLKLALFMFAIGLGSSYAYATPRPGCISACTLAYKHCIQSLQAPEECRAERLECNSMCNGIPL
ncbi:hypothetical protein CSQ96_13200 [Janthinobacterium sp. BJB412]|nr:hypothetical protein CSQ96_13200 [Janthinobacterium sp. BJB412]